MLLLLSVWVLLFHMLRCICGDLTFIKIGGLFTDAVFETDGKAAFLAAVDYVNSRPDLLPEVLLQAVLNFTNSEPRSYAVLQSACTLAQEGVGLVVGPATSEHTRAVAPVFSALHLPSISPQATDPTLSVDRAQYPYLLKMSAPDTFQSNALEDIIRHFGWTKLSVVAEATDYGRNGLQQLQTNALINDWTITSISYFHPHPNISAADMKPVLAEIRKKGTRVILINCLARDARVLMDEAERMRMTGRGWVWIVTDGVTSIDGLFNPCSEVPNYLRGLVGTRPTTDQGALYETFEQIWYNLTGGPPRQAYSGQVFDAVLVAAYGLHDYLAAGHVYQPPQFQNAVCLSGSVTPWSTGHTLQRYVEQTSGDGVNNFLRFTNLGFIEETNYDIVNLRSQGWEQVGTWSNSGVGGLDLVLPVVFAGDTAEVPAESVLSLHNVNLRFVTILLEPYMMHVNESEFTGYCLDLLKKLQQSLGFSYELYVVPDGQYGGQDPDNRHWNGMMGELTQDRADLAIAPLTISYEREQYVDFTKPFQDLGAIILMAKQTSSDNFLAFFDPFSWELWGAVVSAFIVCGFLNAVVSWLSPHGHRGRYTSRLRAASGRHRDDRNTFNLWNSLWYSFSQWMMQGTEISPQSFSGRLVYGVWYFVVMVISATYTANLAAFLTVQRLDSGIKSLEDLARQSGIKYGTVANSALEKFFDTQSSDPYPLIRARMQEHRTYVTNTSLGIQRVMDSFGKPRDEQYAFIFDSAPLEFASNQKPCSVKTVGRVFNQFGYGLALQKGSPYRDMFSMEILKLRQSGFLSSLKKRWITTGLCEDDNSFQTGSSMAQQATLSNMTGVFCFMLAGLLLLLPVILCECCMVAYRDRRVSSRRKQTLTMRDALSRRYDAITSDCRRHCSVCIGCYDTDDSSDNDTDKQTSAVGNQDNGHINGVVFSDIKTDQPVHSHVIRDIKPRYTSDAIDLCQY